MASDNPKTAKERVTSEGVNLYVVGAWIGRVNYIEFVDTAKERLIAALESMRTEAVKSCLQAAEGYVIWEYQLNGVGAAENDEFLQGLLTRIRESTGVTT